MTYQVRGLHTHSDGTLESFRTITSDRPRHGDVVDGDKEIVFITIDTKKRTADINTRPLKPLF